MHGLSNCCPNIPPFFHRLSFYFFNPGKFRFDKGLLPRHMAISAQAYNLAENTHRIRALPAVRTALSAVASFLFLNISRAAFGFWEMKHPVLRSTQSYQIPQYILCKASIGVNEKNIPHGIDLRHLFCRSFNSDNGFFRVVGFSTLQRRDLSVRKLLSYIEQTNLSFSSISILQNFYGSYRNGSAYLGKRRG